MEFAMNAADFSRDFLEYGGPSPLYCMADLPPVRCEFPQPKRAAENGGAQRVPALWPQKCFLSRRASVIFRADDEDIRRTKISRTTDCGGRAGRLRKVHPDLFAQTLAGDPEPQGVFQRMELVRAGEGRHKQGQEAGTADARDLQPDSRDGFCGSVRAAACALAARRIPRVVRSLYLHGLRARCGPRLPAGVGPRQL